MKQIITISVEKGKSFDIQMDSGQRIKTTLRVLRDNVQGLKGVLTNIEVREKHSGRKIDIEQTYEEAKIYTGFELIVLPRDQQVEKSGKW